MKIKFQVELDGEKFAKVYTMGCHLIRRRRIRGTKSISLNFMGNNLNHIPFRIDLWTEEMLVGDETFTSIY